MPDPFPARPRSVPMPAVEPDGTPAVPILNLCTDRDALAAGAVNDSILWEPLVRPRVAPRPHDDTRLEKLRQPDGRLDLLPVAPRKEHP